MRQAPDWERWASHPDLVQFYERHRSRPEDLYPSERRFLPWLARQSRSVLDVGCATGGFMNIWQHFGGQMAYSGVDVSDSLIAAARRIYPGVSFLHGDCAAGLPLPSSSADIVQALGWLHWEPRYADAIGELWRLTRRFVFFDVRLVDEPADLDGGVQRLAFSEEWDGSTTTPYICAAWLPFTCLLAKLEPARILGYGYWGKPADTVDGVEREVCFATFVLERPSEAGAVAAPIVALDLPLLWPSTEGRVVRADLHSIVPKERKERSP